MSLPSVPGPTWRHFQGWSLPHFMLDGSLSMLLTLVGSVLLHLSLWQIVILGGLSFVAMTSAMMLWIGRRSNAFDFSDFQGRDQGFELVRQSDNVAHIIGWIGKYMNLAPVDRTHQDHVKMFLEWREIVSAFLTAVASEGIVSDFRAHCEPDNPLKAQTYLFGLQGTFSRRDLRDASIPMPLAQPQQAQLPHVPPG